MIETELLDKALARLDDVQLARIIAALNHQVDASLSPDVRAHCRGIQNDCYRLLDSRYALYVMPV